MRLKSSDGWARFRNIEFRHWLSPTTRSLQRVASMYATKGLQCSKTIRRERDAHKHNRNALVTAEEDMLRLREYWYEPINFPPRRYKEQIRT